MKNYDVRIKTKYDDWDWEDAYSAGTFSVEDGAEDGIVEKKVRELVLKYLLRTLEGFEMVGFLWEVIHDHHLEEAVNELLWEDISDGSYQYKVVEADK